MTEGDKAVATTKTPPAVSGLVDNEIAIKLVAEMLAGRIVTIKPQYDFTTELGYIYPAVEQTLKLKGNEALAILESLTAKGIVNRSFFDRLIRCPRCQSPHLRPSSHCPKCGSGYVARGRILEHFACKYIGLEDEFTAKGKYVCPRCKMELRTIGTDYRSQGVLYKCRDCSEIFSVPFLKWRCLKCSSLLTEDEVGEVVIYSYTFDESKRNWLEFELQPKVRFIELLRQHGYKVTENARVPGKSGAEHYIDILATRDDGVVTHTIAIGVEIARERIGLDRVLDFDVKAYDSGIHDKVMITIPALGEEARKFASYNRIKVLEPKDLEIVLRGSHQPGWEIVKEPFEFKSKSQLVQYLEKQGYKVKEKAEVKGRSGAVHHIDMLATKDEVMITHLVAIGIEVDEKPMGLDRVFDFDDKAYDTGILDKVFIAVPGLTKEARQFATRQGIRVFEVSQLEPPTQEKPKS
jgi:phosphoribosyl-dephospho-CoA transferase